MENLKVILNNCYGIKSLNEEFNFGVHRDGKKCNSQLIYAKNGLMKSSFARTFKDISLGKSPIDRVSGSNGDFEIKINNAVITEEQKSNIYVIESEPNNQKSNYMSRLLVNDNLKRQYISTIKKIEGALNSLLEDIIGDIQTRGIGNVKSKISADFKINENDIDIIELLVALEQGINEIPEKYGYIDYKICSTAQLKTFLKDGDINDLFQNFYNQYNEVIKKSRYYQDGFDLGKSSVISTTLDKNNFFNAKHKLILTNKQDGSILNINNTRELEKTFKEEQELVFSDPLIRKTFENIISNLGKNKELTEFKDYIINNKRVVEILSEHNGKIDEFILKMWLGIFKKNIKKYNIFLEIYNNSKEIIKNILLQAEQEEAIWYKIIDDFNKKFNPPFKLILGNKSESITGMKEPIIEFLYNDCGSEYPKQENILRDILSTGEKRIYFILNILFDIYGLKKATEQKETKDIIIVIDDIADSFDYRNKYGIIEYLREISEDQNIYMIILTHNFDFFRTLHSRILKKHDQCWIATKNQKSSIGLEGTINLIRLDNADLIDPFKKFRQNYHKNKKTFIATIPFVREIILFSQGINDDYKKLSNVLHFKGENINTSIQEIKDIFIRSINGERDLIDEFDQDFDLTMNSFDFILQEGALISNNPTSGIDLESRVILAITTRLISEKYMYNFIRSHEASYELNPDDKYPTKILFDKYVELNGTEIKTLKSVLLCTPETIHLNSFMYEPLIDMGIDELCETYKEVMLLIP